MTSQSYRILQYLRMSDAVVKKYNGWKSTKLIIGFIVLVAVVFLVLSDREKIFSLNLSTEVAAFTITDSILSESWDVGNARLLTDRFDIRGEGELLENNPTLLVNKGTEVKIQRHGLGAIRILLARNDGSPVGSVKDEKGNETTLSNWALLIIKPDYKPFVFPFRGTLIVGDDVAVGVNSMLLSGTVSVVEEQLMGNAHYVAGVENLDSGDRVQLLLKDGGDKKTFNLATVDGFVRAEPRDGFADQLNGLALVAHGRADYVQVERLGSAGYRITASRWARFLHDPVLVGFTAIVALLALLFELFSQCLDFIVGNFAQNKREPANVIDESKGCENRDKMKRASIEDKSGAPSKHQGSTDDQ